MFYNRLWLHAVSSSSEIQSTDIESESMYLNINISHHVGKSPRTSISSTKPNRHETIPDTPVVLLMYTDRSSHLATVNLLHNLNKLSTQ